MMISFVPDNLSGSRKVKPARPAVPFSTRPERSSRPSFSSVDQ